MAKTKASLKAESLKVCANLKRDEELRKEKKRNADLQRRLRTVQQSYYTAKERIDFFELVAAQ